MWAKPTNTFCLRNLTIAEPVSYTHLKRGLRDLDGKGVLTGLTDISTIIQNKEVDGKLVPCDGELYYRGYKMCIRDSQYTYRKIIKI